MRKKYFEKFLCSFSESASQSFTQYIVNFMPIICQEFYTLINETASKKNQTSWSYFWKLISIYTL